MEHNINKINLVIVGDIAFAGGLSRDPISVTPNIDVELRNLFADSIVVGNLEGPLLEKVPGEVLFPRLASPVQAVEVLKDLNIQAVSLANNHILDYGKHTLQATIERLEAAGIAHFGAGMDLNQALKPAIVDKSGHRFGFLGFDGSWHATESRAGCIPLQSRLALEAIRRARQDCNFLVVYFHQGIEACNYPLKSTMAECHAAVESGADLVVGTHPHTVQGVEYYKGVPIAYSLGNFILPLAWADLFEVWQPQTLLARLGYAFEKALITQGMALVCQARNHKVDEIRAVPIRVDETGIPRALKGDELDAANQFLTGLSDLFQFPEHQSWKFRDEIEHAHFKNFLKGIDFNYVLQNITKIRLRHFTEILRAFHYFQKSS